MLIITLIFLMILYSTQMFSYLLLSLHLSKKIKIVVNKLNNKQKVTNNQIKIKQTSVIKNVCQKYNMNYNNILLFTDLDGTLLNKKTFEFKAALDLVKNCIKKGINIIPNSSKTDLELNLL